MELDINQPLKRISELFQNGYRQSLKRRGLSELDESENKNNNSNNNDDMIYDDLLHLKNDHIDDIKEWGIYSHFEKLLSDDKLYSSIPYINTISESDASLGKLVRVRCMIQDAFDPQYYLGVYRVRNINTNQLRYDTVAFKSHAIDFTNEEEFDEEYDGITFERNQYFCIPIPCESKWSQQYRNNKINNNINKNDNKSNKRSIEEDYTKNEDKMVDEIDNINNNNNNKNNSNSNSNSNYNDNEEYKQKNKKSNIGNNSSTFNNYEKDTNIKKVYNYPIPTLTNLSPFIVCVYDNKDIESMKVNEVVEFVGVVSRFISQKPVSEINQCMDATTLEYYTSGMDIDENEQTRLTPESMVPRFHAISHRILNQYIHPKDQLYPFSIKPTTAIDTNLLNKDKIKNIRDKLIKYIEQHLMGDTLASEYLLCHLLSKVYQRISGLSLGNFPLNLILPKPSDSDHQIPLDLERLFDSLVSRSHMVRLTIDNLNDGDFIPFKDYDLNRIISGLLQLPKNTHLIIDETNITEGKLYEQGIKNLEALKKISLHQHVEYDFHYHPIEIETDLPILTLSYGKSLIPINCSVKVKNSTNLLVKDFVDESLLNQFREYIGELKNANFKVSNDGSSMKYIEDDFVAARQIDPNISQHVFHHWLTLSRWLAISFGEDSVSVERWKYMRQLENDRNK